MRDGRFSFRVFMSQSFERRTVGRSKSEWADNISRYVQDLGFKGSWAVDRTVWRQKGSRA